MAQGRYYFTTERVGDHLSARADGERSLDTVTALAVDVAEAARAAGLAKVLVDVRELRGSLRLIDGFLIVNGVFENLRGIGLLKAAIVDHAAPRPGFRFLETLARNRGFRFQVFDDPLEAKQWLALDEV